MKLKDISYSAVFYWKGNKYIQLIRPKNPKGSFKVACMIKGDYKSGYTDISSNCEVKPVVRVSGHD